MCCPIYICIKHVHVLHVLIYNVHISLGVLFSGISIVEATCTLLGSLIYNALYPATIRIHPGMCFFVMAVALLIPFILIL